MHGEKEWLGRELMGFVGLANPSISMTKNCIRKVCRSPRGFPCISNIFWRSIFPIRLVLLGPPVVAAACVSWPEWRLNPLNIPQRDKLYKIFIMNGKKIRGEAEWLMEGAVVIGRAKCRRWYQHSTFGRWRARNKWGKVMHRKRVILSEPIHC